MKLIVDSAGLPAMRTDIIETYAQFEALRADWDRAYEADPEAQFFLSWVWLSQVFKQHPGEWRVLAARPDQDQAEYVAFLPLRLKTRWKIPIAASYSSARRFAVVQQ